MLKLELVVNLSLNQKLNFVPLSQRPSTIGNLLPASKCMAKMCTFFIKRCPSPQPNPTVFFFFFNLFVFKHFIFVKNNDCKKNILMILSLSNNTHEKYYFKKYIFKRAVAGCRRKKLFFFSKSLFFCTKTNKMKRNINDFVSVRFFQQHS